MTTEQLPKEERTKLAKHLARKIFEAPYGCKPDDVFRLQFRGRHERDLGGVCEGALVSVIRDALETFK